MLLQQMHAIAAVALAMLLLPSTPYAPTVLVNAQATAACNGYPELCNRPLNKVAFVTTHNSFAVGNNPAANQHNPISVQLSDGVRGFMIDAHQLNPEQPTDEIQLCHQTCALLSAGPMVTALRGFKQFMDDNPRDFIVIFVENADSFTGAQFARTFAQVPGLTDYAYWRNDTSAEWPTLAALSAQRKRFMILFDNLPSPVAPWQVREYSVNWQTPYEIPFRNPTYTCAVDRPAQKPANSLSTLNHFLFTTISFSGSSIPIPNPDIAAATNGEPLRDHVKLCSTSPNELVPNFVAVDFYEIGEVFNVVADLNGVKYTGNGGTRSSSNGSPSSAVRTALPYVAHAGWLYSLLAGSLVAFSLQQLRN